MSQRPDWVEADTMSAEETLRRFKELNPQLTVPPPDPGEPYESEQEAAFWKRYRERHQNALPPNYWHGYGAMATSGELAGAWLSLVVGPVSSPTPVADSVNPGSVYSPRRADDAELPELPYLCTWDHEPAPAEREAMEPNESAVHLLLE
jgi:hypothetical protein